jgi:tRNA-specific 2-thiouridylase
MLNLKKRVVVGLSGGVDSSVAALLLIEQGYEVVGIFMKNWHDESVTISNDCPWIDDSNDALLIANQLNIPFQVLDLSIEYKHRIVDYMFAEYEAGRTPNPDVLCNREIKFDVFLKAAEKLGADYVATGHYCRKSESNDGIFHLLSGKDSTKDQSYFLCQLNQQQLSKALFPIGDLLKTEVREKATKNQLITANKKDSQGLCFVGKISLPIFLQQQLKAKKGNVIEISSQHPQLTAYHKIKRNENHLVELSHQFTFKESDGHKVAEHQGAHNFTIGQRRGLQVGGRPEPSFVIQIDIENNIVFTGQNENHLGLNKWALKINSSELHWINPTYCLKNGEKLDVLCRIRYRQQLQNATIFQKENELYVLFSQLQKGISPGQFAAFYMIDELIGSGVIA